MQEEKKNFISHDGSHLNKTKNRARRGWYFYILKKKKNKKEHKYLYFVVYDNNVQWIQNVKTVQGFYFSFLIYIKLMEKMGKKNKKTALLEGMINF